MSFLQPLSAHSTPLLITALIIAFVLIRTLLSPGKTGTLPPGPPGYPVIGNLLGIPTKDKWKVYRQWAREFKSDIISLKIPGSALIVLNSAAVTDALFVKRSAIYADRPRMVMLNDLVGAGWNIAIMPYGEKFKTARKLWHKHIDVSYCKPHADMTVRWFLKRVLTCTKDHDRLIRLMTGRFILSSGYGIQVESADDPFISLSETWIKTIAHATQRGAYLVDSIPILKFVPSWFPGAGFQHHAANMRTLTENVRTLPFKCSQEQVVKGVANPSYASRFLESTDSEKTPEEIDAVCSIIGNMYLAGADTTELTLRTFILAMALHPEIQQKGQQIMDEALDHGKRMPTITDAGSIPYVDAIINEMIRWKPALTVCIPHGALQDDYYEGYLIPKGAIVVANICAILQDEALYGPRTNEFRPERWLLKDEDGGALDTSMNADAAFGYGRRLCLGKAMSRELTWMTVASMLASVNIGPAIGENGMKMEASTVEYITSGNLNFPPRFNCSFSPRSAAAKNWIDDASEAVQ